jgi:hypothetical protein
MVFQDKKSTDAWRESGRAGRFFKKLLLPYIGENIREMY